MALPQQKTLGGLRSELRVRLGFASQGASAGPNQALMDSFLRSAQEQMYWQYDWEILRKIWDKAIGQGQTLLDYPDDCEPRRVLEIRVQVGTRWIPMDEGIEYEHDDTVASRSYPQRFDRRAQIELWPEAGQGYTVRIEGYQRLGAFTQNNDRATLDSELVLLHALTAAKYHYRQPDAGSYGAQLRAYMDRLSAGAHGNKRYIPNPGGERRPPPEPVLKT